MQYNHKWFRDVCFRKGIVYSEFQSSQMAQYVELLLDWNKKINLISRKDESNIWLSHILHSVSLFFKVSIEDEARIVDIGTGGGLPSIPLKILKPDISVLCIDSTLKKISALTEIVQCLKLEKINVVYGRAEEIGKEYKYKGKFDYTIARAVAPLSDLVNLAKIFLKKINLNELEAKDLINGTNRIISPALLAYKGGDISKEIDFMCNKSKPKANKIINLDFIDSGKILLTDKKIVVVRP